MPPLPRRTRSGEALREPPRARVGEALRLPLCSSLGLGAGAGAACQCGTRVGFVVVGTAASTVASGGAL